MYLLNWMGLFKFPCLGLITWIIWYVGGLLLLLLHSQISQHQWFHFCLYSYNFVPFSTGGWLLDIAKLQLGENIGEGEFGGNFTSQMKIYSVHDVVYHLEEVLN